MVGWSGVLSHRGLPPFTVFPKVQIVELYSRSRLLTHVPLTIAHRHGQWTSTSWIGYPCLQTDDQAQFSHASPHFPSHPSRYPTALTTRKRSPETLQLSFNVSTSNLHSNSNRPWLWSRSSIHFVHFSSTVPWPRVQ